MKWREVSKLCKCGKPRRPGQRECRQCHATAVREYRRRLKDEIEKLRAEIQRLREAAKR
jgi:hypothetical protein